MGEKMKSTLNIVLKKKRIMIGKRGKHTMLAAEWVDSELIENINIRSRLSRNWRIARKKNESEEIQKACKEKYEKQQKKTAVLSGKKRGDWKKKKIEETWKNGKKKIGP